MDVVEDKVVDFAGFGEVRFAKRSTCTRFCEDTNRAAVLFESGEMVEQNFAELDTAVLVKLAMAGWAALLSDSMSPMPNLSDKLEAAQTRAEIIRRGETGTRRLGVSDLYYFSRALLKANGKPLTPDNVAMARNLILDTEPVTVKGWRDNPTVKAFMTEMKESRENGKPVAGLPEFPL